MLTPVIQDKPSEVQLLNMHDRLTYHITNTYHTNNKKVKKIIKCVICRQIYRFQVYNYIIIYTTFDHHKESVKAYSPNITQQHFLLDSSELQTASHTIWMN